MWCSEEQSVCSADVSVCVWLIFLLFLLCSSADVLCIYSIVSSSFSSSSSCVSLLMCSVSPPPLSAPPLPPPLPPSAAVDGGVSLVPPLLSQQSWTLHTHQAFLLFCLAVGECCLWPLTPAFWLAERQRVRVCVCLHVPDLHVTFLILTPTFKKQKSKEMNQMESNVNIIFCLGLKCQKALRNVQNPFPFSLKWPFSGLFL